MDEPDFTDEEMEHLLRLHLGDYVDNELVDMCKLRLLAHMPLTHIHEELDSHILSKKDHNLLLILATHLHTHFSRQTWNDLRRGVCKDLDIPTEFIAWHHLRILADLETCVYDCCVNSCCCFLGKYKEMDHCPFCDEAQYNSCGKVRRLFRYTPLIPQLCSLFQSTNMAAKLGYRARVEKEKKENKSNTIEDIFDGEDYQSLRSTQLNPDNPYHFFDNPEDIALGLSTDGFTLFKRRRRGHSTAWPIILINYNLHPRIRTRLENVICVG
jgi:hypothetical protein